MEKDLPLVQCPIQAKYLASRLLHRPRRLLGPTGNARSALLLPAVKERSHVTLLDHDLGVIVPRLARGRGSARSGHDKLYVRHRDRLRRMVEVRLDCRLETNYDASQVIQNAFLDVGGGLNKYLRKTTMPLCITIRLVVAELQTHL